MNASGPGSWSGWPNVSRISGERVTWYAVRAFDIPLTTIWLPEAETLRPGISGATRTRPARSDFASTGFVVSTRHGASGVQRPPQPHSCPATRNGPYVRKDHDCASLVRRGPSADGVPGPIDISTAASAGSAVAATSAIERRGAASLTSRATASSFATSASVASRSVTAAPAARARIEPRTAAGSTSWSNAANTTASRRATPPSGCRTTTRGAGVANVHATSRASRPPVAEAVPAGTTARNSVAIGRRRSGWKTTVRVPTQRHSPGTLGSSRTGTLSPPSASCVSSATIGCENVTLRFGASGTSPSGARRSTSSGPAAATSGRGLDSGGGNGAAIVLPVRGGGSESSRRAKGVVWGAPASGGRRSRTRRASASVSGSAAGRGTGCVVSPLSSASLRRKDGATRAVVHRRHLARAPDAGLDRARFDAAASREDRRVRRDGQASAHEQSNREPARTGHP